MRDEPRTDQAAGELTRDPSDKDPHRRKVQRAVGDPQASKRGVFEHTDVDAFRTLDALACLKTPASGNAVEQATTSVFPKASFYEPGKGVWIKCSSALQARWIGFTKRVKVDPEMALILLLDIYEAVERDLDRQPAEIRGHVDLMRKGRG